MRPLFICAAALILSVQGMTVRYSSPPSRAGQEIDVIQPPWGLSPEVGGISTRVIKAEPFDACTRLTNKCSELEGAIALVERGTCPFTTKAMIVSMSCPPRNTSAPGKRPFRCSDLASECEPRRAEHLSRDVKALMHEWCPKTCSAKTCGVPKRRREAPHRLQGNTTIAPTTGPPCTDKDEAVNKVSRDERSSSTFMQEQ